MSFFKDGRDAGEAPTREPHTSNSRGNYGIFAYGGHICKRRIPLPLMPACNDLQIVGEIVYTKLYISICIYGRTRNYMIYVWSYEKLYYICITCTVCSSVKYV